MTKLEVVNLLENFTGEVIVCVEDHSTGLLRPIEAISGEAERETGKFFIRINVGGENETH